MNTKMTLLEKYRKGLKPFVVEEWVDLILYRPLGFAVALPLTKTPVTPNQVTFASVVVGVAGAWAMAQGTYEMLVWGAILYMLSNVLDCSDGQLARMTQRFSRYGRIYDGVADYVVGLGTFLALGMAWKPAAYSSWEWWLLVIIGGMAGTTYQSMHLNHVRQAYLKALQHTDGSSMVHKGKKKKKSKAKGVFYIAFYYLYRLYLSIERSVRLQVRLPIYMPDSMRNSKSLRMTLILWTFTGKGTHVTLLAFFMLIGRPDYYFWFCLIPANIWVYALLRGHRDVLQKLSVKTETQSHESVNSSSGKIGTNGGTHSSVSQNSPARSRETDPQLDATGVAEK